MTRTTAASVAWMLVSAVAIVFYYIEAGVVLIFGRLALAAANKQAAPVAALP